MLFALLVVLIGLAARLIAARARRASPRSGSRAAVRGSVGLVGLAAGLWAVASFALIRQADPVQRQVVICALHGVIASSVLLAPLPAAAWLLAILPALGVGAAIASSGPGSPSFHPALLTATFLVLLQAIRFGASDFARRVHNGYAAAEQHDIISMLLRDFEAGASDALWQTGPDFRLGRVSRRLAAMLGQPEHALRDACLIAWLDGACAPAPPAHPSPAHPSPAAGRTALERALRARVAFRDVVVRIGTAGDERILSFTGTPIFGPDGSFGGFRGVGSDITAATRSEERITRLARFDALTGIANRASFRERLEQACDDDVPFCLTLLDLDGFKPVNDAFGHQAGDAVLAETASRIRDALAGAGLAGVACRIGGDEFAMLCPIDDRARARAFAETLIAALGRPVVFDGKTLAVGVSIGLAFPSAAGWDADILFRGADLALYQAKARGRGIAVLSEPEFAIAAEGAHRLRAELRDAVLTGALELDFQPIVDLATGAVVSAEALVRWPHAVRGRMQPADFIPLAEETGLIVPLGAWVLRHACREAASWAGDARVAVNLSGAQFRDPGLLATIEAALADAGLPPERLELEITESVFLDAIEPTLACLHTLRARGVRIALDDFGTGYSALNYLRSFPFDRMKIDRAFVSDLGTSRNATVIVQAIVGLASSLGISTTGEGVETTSQVELLQSTGCSHVQGYLFGRPCGPDTIARIMRAGSGSGDGG